MTGNPDKRGKTGAGYQLGRRRHTRAPGYHGVLPRVFGYKKDLSREDAEGVVRLLLEVEKDGFALTSHPSTLDGHVTLWVSEEVAEWVERVGDIGEFEEVGK